MVVSTVYVVTLPLLQEETRGTVRGMSSHPEAGFVLHCLSFTIYVPLFLMMGCLLSPF